MHDAPPVLEVLGARLRAGGRPPSDRYRLGLAIEGGGMRGIVSAAATIALQEAGALRAFDAIYGVSAGSLNAAYILAGQAWVGLSIYYDHLATGDFIAFSRALRRRPVVSMAVVRRIIDSDVPLDRAAVMAATPPLHVAVSNLTTCSPELRSGFSTPEELETALMEGAHLPVLAGRPARRDGNLYVDGGVFFPHAVYAAVAGGCTHVLALTTRVQGDNRPRLSAWEGSVARLLNRWAPGAGDKYLAELRRYVLDRQRMGYGETEIAGRRVYRLAADPGAHTVQRLTRDRVALLTGARCGYDVGASLLEQCGRRASASQPYLQA